MGKLHLGNTELGTAAVFKDAGSVKLATPSFSSFISDQYIELQIDATTAAYADKIKVYNGSVLVHTIEDYAGTLVVLIFNKYLGEGSFNNIRIKAAAEGFQDSEFSNSTFSTNIAKIDFRLQNLIPQLSDIETGEPTNVIYQTLGHQLAGNILPNSGYYLPENLTVNGPHSEFFYNDLDGNFYITPSSSAVVTIIGNAETENRLRTPTLEVVEAEKFSGKIPYGSRSVEFYDADGLADATIENGEATPFFVFDSSQTAVPGITFEGERGTISTNELLPDADGIYRKNIILDGSLWEYDPVAFSNYYYTAARQLDTISYGNYAIIRFKFTIPSGYTIENIGIQTFHSYVGNGINANSVYYVASFPDMILPDDSSINGNVFANGTFWGPSDYVTRPNQGMQHNFDINFLNAIDYSVEEHFIEVKVTALNSTNLSNFSDFRVIFGMTLMAGSASGEHKYRVFDLNEMNAPKGLNTIAALAKPDESLGYLQSRVSNRISLTYNPIDIIEEEGRIYFSGASEGINKIEININGSKYTESGWSGPGFYFDYTDKIDTNSFRKAPLTFTVFFENGTSEEQTIYVGGVKSIGEVDAATVTRVANFIAENNLTEAGVFDEIGWSVGDEIVLDTMCPAYNQSFPIPYRILGFNHDVRPDGSRVGITLMATRGIMRGTLYPDNYSPFQSTNLCQQLLNTYLTDTEWSSAQAVIKKEFYFTNGNASSYTLQTFEHTFVNILANETDCGFYRNYGIRYPMGSPYAYFRNVAALPGFKAYPDDSLGNGTGNVALPDISAAPINYQHMYIYGSANRAKGTGINDYVQFSVVQTICPIIGF